jgi:hypothetical protein
MSLHHEFRKDWRNDEQFARDILEGHVIEANIIMEYADYLRRVYSIEVEIKDNGVDNTGAVLNNDEVDARADYLLNGQPIEVKYIKEHADEFRLKKEQVLSYIEQGAFILLVNGWMTEKPTFTLIKTERLKEIVQTKRTKPFETWGYKRCYFLKKYHFQWFSFR